MDNAPLELSTHLGQIHDSEIRSIAVTKNSKFLLTSDTGNCTIKQFSLADDQLLVTYEKIFSFD